MIRKFALFLILVCMQTGMAAFGQMKEKILKRKIPRPVNYYMTSLVLALQDLTLITGVASWMDNGVCMRYTRPVTYRGKDVTLREVLDNIFLNQPMDYDIDDKTGRIILVPRPLKGRIMDPLGNPLMGVTVIIPRIDTLQTDANGEFMVDSAACESFVQFSHIGYEAHHQELKGDTVIALRMKAKPLPLDSAIIIINTGYELLPKELVAGSSSYVSQPQIEQRVTTSIEETLEGAASGLLMNKNRLPGMPLISIRGQATINANTEPLWVVDDLPYYGDISNFNINDIQSVTVLKDAAATSLWGVRAANGVIVITTKKGRELKMPRLELSSSLTISAKPDLLYLTRPGSGDFIDINAAKFGAGDYDQALNSKYELVPPDVEIMQKRRLGNINDKEETTQLNELRARDIRKDLSKQLYQNGITQRHTISVTGGAGPLTYYAGGGFEKEKMAQVDNFRQRATLTGNLHYNEKACELSLQGFLTTTRFDGHPMPGGLYPYSQLTDSTGKSTAVPRDLNDDYKFRVRDKVQDWYYYPLDDYRQNNISNKGLHSRITFSAKVNFLKHFSAKIIYEHQSGTEEYNDVKSAVSYYARNLQNRFFSSNSGYILLQGGVIDLENSKYSADKMRLQLNYNWQGKPGFRLSALGGIEYSKFSRDTLVARYYGYYGNLNTAVPSSDFTGMYRLFYDPSKSSEIPHSNHIGTGLDFFYSAFGNAAYTFWHNYIISISGRIDQSNLLGAKPNHKGIPLYSLGFKWNAGDERFYPLKFFPYCTLRGSIGRGGNVDKRTAAYTTAAVAPANRYGAIPVGIINPENPDLRWESSRLINAGIELATRGKHLELSFEYYDRKSIWLLGPGEQDPTLGASYFWGNNCGLKARGVDFEIRTNHKIGKDWTFKNTVFVSRVTNEVSRYDKAYKKAWYYTDPKFLSPKVGAPVHSVYAYRWAGLDTLGDPQGYLKGASSKNYRDIFESSPDSVLMLKGSAVPKLFGSLTCNISYRRLALAFTLTGKFNYVFRRSSVYYSEPNNVMYMGLNDYPKRWKQRGDESNTNVPSVKNDPDRDLFYNYTELLIEKGDHIRLQNVNLSYTMSSEALKRWKCQSLKFYLAAEGFGPLWKKAPGNIDPDFQTGLRIPKSIAIGLTSIF